MTGTVIRAAGPEDHELLDGLLRGLSSDSAYLRFQTGIGAKPSHALLRALLPSEGAVLGFVDGEVVAHGMWARAGRAEIAVLVADAHQGRGIGTAMVEAFSGAGNEAVARMVARRAPNALRVLEGPTVTYTFPVHQAVPARRPGTAWQRPAAAR